MATLSHTRAFARKLAEAREEQRTLVMAVLNLTPDSFSDGGHHAYDADPEAVLETVADFVRLGVDVIDVGGESTRPGASEVPLEEELNRVVPMTALIRAQHPELLMSVDTRKAQVAAAALEAGVNIINDVSGLQFDDTMADVVARYDAGLILMHSQGSPENMQDNPSYGDVVAEVKVFLHRQAVRAVEAGVDREQLMIDPGFGFGKTLVHNATLMKELDGFQELGFPLLVGTSRKSFLAMGDGTIAADSREALTAATLALAIQAGVQMVRIHDVETQGPVIRLMDRILR